MKVTTQTTKAIKDNNDKPVKWIKWFKEKVIQTNKKSKPKLLIERSYYVRLESKEAFDKIKGQLHQKLKESKQTKGPPLITNEDEQYFICSKLFFECLEPGVEKQEDVEDPILSTLNPLEMKMSTLSSLEMKSKGTKTTIPKLTDNDKKSNEKASADWKLDSSNELSAEEENDSKYDPLQKGIQSQSNTGRSKQVTPTSNRHRNRSNARAQDKPKTRQDFSSTASPMQTFPFFSSDEEGLSAAHPIRQKRKHQEDHNPLKKQKTFPAATLHPPGHPRQRNSSALQIKKRSREEDHEPVKKQKPALLFIPTQTPDSPPPAATTSTNNTVTHEEILLSFSNAKKEALFTYPRGNVSILWVPAEDSEGMKTATVAGSYHKGHRLKSRILQKLKELNQTSQNNKLDFITTRLIRILLESNQVQLIAGKKKGLIMRNYGALAKLGITTSHVKVQTIIRP